MISNWVAGRPCGRTIATGFANPVPNRLCIFINDLFGWLRNVGELWAGKSGRRRQILPGWRR
jgi:hypothetical protein